MWILLVLLIPASRLVSSSFPSGTQLQNIAILGVFLVVIGFGQGFVILTGGIDLSVSSTLVATAYTTAWLVSEGDALILAILGGLAVATAIGFVNGIGVALMRVPPFIMTLAVSTITVSALLGIDNSSPARPAPSFLVNLFSGTATIGGIPKSAYILVALALIGYAIQHLSAYGRRVYAIGSAERAARISALPVSAILVTVYMVAAVFYGLGGLLLLGFSGNARLDLGDPWLLPSIAAVLVGGTAISGGRGSYLGTVAGALLLTAVGVDITAAGLAPGWQQVLYGLIVLITLVIARAAGGNITIFRPAAIWRRAQRESPRRR